MKKFVIFAVAGMLATAGTVGTAQAKQFRMPAVVWTQHVLCTIEHHKGGLTTQTCRTWKTGKVPKDTNKIDLKGEQR